MRQIEKILLFFGLIAFFLALTARGWLHAQVTVNVSTPSAAQSETTPPTTSNVTNSQTPDASAGTNEGTIPKPEKPGNLSASRQVADVLSKMSDWEKVCQLFIVSPNSLSGVTPTTACGERTKAGLDQYPVGGLIYFSENLVSPQQTRELTCTVQEYSKYGLFIAIDEEGGTVSRLAKKLGTTPLNSMYTYRNDGTKTAYTNAMTIAKDLTSYGFNTDFAPVADVRSNPMNEVIGPRAYSDDPNQAAELVAAAVQGFHDGDIICSLKHFPGHGDTKEDSHTGTAYLNKTKEELFDCELLPFISGIKKGTDMVMVGHLTVPSMDTIPASISHTIITGLLRQELGFDGVVISDALKMAAISDYDSAGEVAVDFVQAGGDILLDPTDLADATKGLMDALNAGQITEERLNESVIRILMLKAKYGIL